MSTYFFHYRDDRGVIVDDEGGDFATFELAADEARASAHEMSIENAKHAPCFKRAYIEMTMGSNVLLTVPLADFGPHLHTV